MGKNTKKDTVPASRSARGWQTQTSGVHRQIDAPSVSGDRFSGVSRHSDASDDEAHTEMERAVTRGDCAILSDVELGELRRQQTAWLTPTHGLVLDAWYCAPRGKWTKAASLAIDADGASRLAEFLERLERDATR